MAYKYTHRVPEALYGKIMFAKDILKWHNKCESSQFMLLLSTRDTQSPYVWGEGC